MINKDELLYEIIISKGKGKITPKCFIMFKKIADGVVKKFNFYYEEELKEDCVSGAFLQLCDNYINFNEKKYDNAFAYLSEIAKRKVTLEIRSAKGWKRQHEPIIVSLNIYND